MTPLLGNGAEQPNQLVRLDLPRRLLRPLVDRYGCRVGTRGTNFLLLSIGEDLQGAEGSGAAGLDPEFIEDFLDVLFDG